MLVIHWAVGAWDTRLYSAITYGHLTAPTKMINPVDYMVWGSDGAACLPEQSEYCWQTEGTFSCSMVRFLTGHYRHCNWPVEKASQGICPCKSWTFWAPFVKKLLQTICIFFMCFWFNWLLPMVSDFSVFDAW